MNLDHIFLFATPEEPEATALADLGLVESFRRDHPGQGTGNLCYCFDNAYLELLRLTDEAEARAPGVSRLHLAERARWRDSGACPFGIALRGAPSLPFPALPFPSWDYRPAYLPEGKSIPIAVFSDDAAQPLVFLSPGDRRPDQWDDGRAGARQTAAGLGEIFEIELILPRGTAPAGELGALARENWFTVTQGGQSPQMILTLTRAKDAPLRLLLPDCRVL